MAISIRHRITHKETPICRKLETYKFLLHFNDLLDYFVAVRQLHFCHFVDSAIPGIFSMMIYSVPTRFFGSEFQANTSGTRIEVRDRTKIEA